MVLKEILDIYHKELDVFFGKEEVDSFFSLVIQHYLGLRRIHLVLKPEYALTTTEEQPLFEALSKLKLKHPIQYILGETEFYGLPFKVNEHTLIPRPETEELVAFVIANLKDQNLNSKPIRILDIGTGSGCIAISLAKHFPEAKVYALDVSEDTLNVAKQNAELNGVNIQFIHDDILNPRYNALDMKSKFDIIVSNPPYVRELEKAEIQPNVLDNEPHLALFVEDANPLQFYKAICEFAEIHLIVKGRLYFEINEYLGAEMIALMKSFGFKGVELKTDMFGKDRMIIAHK